MHGDKPGTVLADKYELIAKAGAGALPDAPLAWLRMEALNLDVCELRLSHWSGEGERFDKVLARCGFHGQFIEWGAA